MAQEMLSRSVFEEGMALLIDKPYEWTSFDVVRKVRYLVKTRKVGHAGTLDPLATGLLIVCTGKMTKMIQQYMAQEKEYEGTFVLGQTTPTYDLESEPGDVRPWQQLTLEHIREKTRAFTGTIQQVPPMHSAIKKDGKRMYELARKGIHQELEPRTITISSFDILEQEENRLTFRVVCSTGTYIRSLANDLGEALGCGAYLQALRRTRIGEFQVKEAYTMTTLPPFIAQQLSQNG
ncbi:MAG: tRNA pseudouridine(55) synthase TruB [Chitinophagaceae bacterium]